MKNALLKEKLQEMNFIMSDLLVMIEKDDISHEAIRENLTSMPEAWARNQKNLENRILPRYDPKEEEMNQPAHTSLRRRNNGLYELRYCYCGAQKSLYGRTKDEVFAKYKQTKVKSPKTLTKSYTLENWMIMWFQTFKKNQVSEKTYKILYRTFELHFEKIAKVKITSLTPLQIQSWLNTITQSRTKESCCQLIKEALRVAQQNKLVKENPAEYIKNVKSKRKIGAALTPEEQKDFISKLEDTEYKDVFLFLLYSGARRSEALRLEEPDVNYEKKLIHIRGTKTEKSDRYIPLFASLRPLVEGKSGKIFDFLPDTLTRVFKKICPAHKLHDLRHTFATRCIEAGASLKTVQTWLGHASIEMTANTYSHIQSEFEREEANKIDKFIP